MVKCYRCIYFKKKLNMYNHINYICSKWGIISYKLYPSNIVKSSIQEDCPFFKNIELKNINDISEKNEKDINNDIFLKNKIDIKV